MHVKFHFYFLYCNVQISVKLTRGRYLAQINFQIDTGTIFAARTPILSDRKDAGIYVRRLLAARKPQGRATLIKQTQYTTQFCIQVGCLSTRRRFPRTIDRYYLEVQWTPSKSLRYLYLSGFLGSFSFLDASSFQNGFSCSPIFSRS